MIKSKLSTLSLCLTFILIIFNFNFYGLDRIPKDHRQKKQLEPQPPIEIEQWVQGKCVRLNSQEIYKKTKDFLVDPNNIKLKKLTPLVRIFYRDLNRLNRTTLSYKNKIKEKKSLKSVFLSKVKKLFRKTGISVKKIMFL